MLCLEFHLGENDVVGLRLNTAGVNEGQLSAAPLALAVDAVTGDAGGVLHNGAALADELVEKRAFAHIGAAHDGHNGF